MIPHSNVMLSQEWIKRYFVLYATSQGHFMMYYSDFTECPMYTSEKVRLFVFVVCCVVVVI